MARHQLLTRVKLKNNALEHVFPDCYVGAKGTIHRIISEHTSDDNLHLYYVEMDGRQGYRRGLQHDELEVLTGEEAVQCAEGSIPTSPEPTSYPEYGSEQGEVSMQQIQAALQYIDPVADDRHYYHQPGVRSGPRRVDRRGHVVSSIPPAQPYPRPVSPSMRQYLVTPADTEEVDTEQVRRLVGAWEINPSLEDAPEPGRRESISDPWPGDPDSVQEG